MARVTDDETKITRRMFEECYDDLVNKIDLDILYTELKCQCKVKRLQLSKVYILKCGVTPEVQTVLNLVAAEEDQEFVKWIDVIQTSLSNTSNQKYSHGSIVDKMMQTRMDLMASSTNTSHTACRSTKSQPKSGPKWMGASMSGSMSVRHASLCSPVSVYLMLSRLDCNRPVKLGNRKTLRLNWS